MKVRFKKLHKDAVIPQYQTAGAAGFDLHAVEDVSLYPGETKLIKTGLQVAVPEGHELQVRPRSGMSLKTLFRVANSPGTVDEDFRGELCVIGFNAGIDTIQYGRDDIINIKKGDRIAQGVICPIARPEIVEELGELSSTERGDGGFGHTGK